MKIEGMVDRQTLTTQNNAAALENMRLGVGVGVGV